MQVACKLAGAGGFLGSEGVGFTEDRLSGAAGACGAEDAGWGECGPFKLSQACGAWKERGWRT